MRYIGFGYRALTVSGIPSQGISPTVFATVCGSYNPAPTRSAVWAPPRSLAATKGISVDFSSSGYLDVSVPRVCLRIAPDDQACHLAGFPHSAISGSMRVCHSPELIAAYHGLHRLRVPRHPPHALIHLTSYFDQAKHALSYTSDCSSFSKRYAVTLWIRVRTE